MGFTIFTTATGGLYIAGGTSRNAKNLFGKIGRGRKSIPPSTKVIHNLILYGGT
jgi:hypothetical protein